jgi:organic hydroperoxide reductase OsmC/OhrA
MQFSLEGSSPSGIQTPFEVKVSSLPAIACAIPPEFQGPGGGYSPEDLYGLAAISCLIATFKVFAEKTSVTYDEITGSCVVTIDRPPGKPVGITTLDITLKVINASNKEKALLLLEESKKNCLVTNAMSVEKKYNFEAP